MARRALSVVALALAAALLFPVIVRADDPVRVRFGWSAPADCRSAATVVELTTTVDSRSRQRMVRGRLRRIGPEPIRDVTVCFGRACAKLDGGNVIAAGESARFEVRDVRDAAAKRPTVRCSILEERAIL